MSRKVEIVTVLLDGKYDVKYGFDGKAGAQASAISGEARGCIGTKEDFFMICGKVGANAGPAGEFGSKVVWDHTNKILEFGFSGKLIGGGEIEGQIKF